MAVGLKDESYERLEDRRLRGNRILAFSIMTGRFDLSLQDCFARPSMDNLQVHHLKLYRQKASWYCFSVGIVNNWNELPSFLIVVTSVAPFTNMLNSNCVRMANLFTVTQS